jgi:hypothetical protein
MNKPESRAEAALYELCVTYGNCLPEPKAEALLARVPADADTFVDSVLTAEGLDPTIVNKRARQELCEVVREWLFDDGGRGPKSGLPRLPPEA